MNNISMEEKEYSDRIFFLRSAGKIDDAIECCNDAINQFQENNFFYKIKGDLLFVQKKYSEAVESYLDFLMHIKDAPELFTNFSRFFSKTINVVGVEKSIFRKMLNISRDESYSDVIRKGLLKMICDYWPKSEACEEQIIHVNRNYSSDSVHDAFDKMKELEECEKIYFLSKLDDKNCTKENSSVNKQIIKAMEEAQMYDNALAWVLHMLTYSKDGVSVRSLFRICRLRHDYSDAIKYMEKNNIATLEDFNIQYELVLFYNEQEDVDNRNLTLKRIDEEYPDSIPIAQTLFKFYIKYDMIDNAKAIEQRIDSLRSKKGEKGKKQIIRTVQENQKVVWQRLNDLIEEQEHNRQLLALTELIKGFSHELGQPITNIRYAIQLYFMKNEKDGLEIDVLQKNLLEGILVQTERVGKLLERFAPIVSSKNVKTTFCIYDEVMSAFDEMSIRLNMEGIKYEIQGSREATLYGEVILFSQIFYNLIINSIYAIRKKNIEGKIQVTIKSNKTNLTIEFCDNGIGIPKDIQRKVFNPFYSTKKKDVEEGGEGLGLYIVWNILKMFNGKIYVDPKYNKGAMFVMDIKVEER